MAKKDNLLDTIKEASGEDLEENDSNEDTPEQGTHDEPAPAPAQIEKPKTYKVIGGSISLNGNSYVTVGAKKIPAAKFVQCNIPDLIKGGYLKEDTND